MSALVWSGAAQFAVLSALVGGAGAGLAAATGLLANLRYLLMSFAIAPSICSGPAPRAGVGLRRTDRDGEEWDRRPLLAAVLAIAITLAVTPVAPPGVPVLLGAAAALIGLYRPRPTAGHFIGSGRERPVST